MIGRFLSKMLSLRGDRRGASAIEYGLIAAGIALAIAASIPGIRTSLQTIFTNIATTLAGVD
ncbi:Flp family type IVb pilin [Plastoroseomonas hellenica]|nr:Flp family type IVb pilin [Plastoroseomonas hellenica]